MANSEGQAVAAIDLQAFAVVKHIRVPCAADSGPRELLVHPAKPVVFALTKENGLLHRIDVSTLSLEASRAFTKSVTTMRTAPSGSAAWLLSAQERKLVRVNLDSLVPESLIAVPEGAADLDISPETPMALLRMPQIGQLVAIDLMRRRVAWTAKVGPTAGPARFLKNGRLVLATSPADRLMIALDGATGQRVVELPLALEPSQMCFKQDGGQLFLSGPAQDAVAVVYPFQTQLAGTILAGHAPGAMAASTGPDFLFVANRDSGEVTVIDIQTQKVRAVVPVGRGPEAIAITPDNNFALVLNRDSGDMAVIRVDAMAGRRTKAAPLFTMVPVGSAPVAAVVLRV